MIFVVSVLLLMAVALYLLGFYRSELKKERDKAKEIQDYAIKVDGTAKRYMASTFTGDDVMSVRISEAVHSNSPKVPRDSGA